MRTLALILLIAACNVSEKSKRIQIGEEEVIHILKILDIPKKENYHIHVKVDEYLNDTSLIAHVEQIPNKSEMMDFESDFIYEGMQVYLNRESKSLINWFPDGYYERLLLRKYNGVLVIDQIDGIPNYIIPEGYEDDSLYQVINEDDFL